MRIHRYADKLQMAKHAAEQGAAAIREAIEARGEANIIVATGASQFEMLSGLVKADGIRWDLVRGFHLDEYVGMPITHPASFRLYLWRRFVSQLPLPLKEFHYIDGSGDPAAECRRLGAAISRHSIDVAFVGIGENGHLAFNDPPADFETEEPYLVVDLDEACRRQQLGEGWFESLDDVPRRAISMSVRQIVKSRTVICTVPDSRKAEAVRNTIEGPVTPAVPASVLQKRSNVALFLDAGSASKLSDMAVSC
jgi:glucosamine-6-phosphate deaminase